MTADCVQSKLFNLRLCSDQIGYLTLRLRDRRGAALLRHRNRAATAVLGVNRSSIRYGFRGGAKAIRYGANTSSIFDSSFQRDRRGAALLRHRNRAATAVLGVNRSSIRYGFRGGAKAIRYGANTSSIFDSSFQRDRRGAALLRHRNRAATTVSMCEQKPYTHTIYLIKQVC